MIKSEASEDTLSDKKVGTFHLFGTSRHDANTLLVHGSRHAIGNIWGIDVYILRASVLVRTLILTLTLTRTRTLTLILTRTERYAYRNKKLHDEKVAQQRRQRSQEGAQLRVVEMQQLLPTGDASSGVQQGRGAGEYGATAFGDDTNIDADTSQESVSVVPSGSTCTLGTLVSTESDADTTDESRVMPRWGGTVCFSGKIDKGGIKGSIASCSDAVEVCPVGYKEDPELFQDCLESLKAQEYHNMRITIVVDGNETQADWGMVHVAKQVFGHQLTCINLTHLPDEVDVTEGWKFGGVSEEKICAAQVLCITQPHAGKRNAMYTAFCAAHVRGAAYVLNTDSDTVMQPNCVARMVEAMKQCPHSTGAVAGILRIFGPYNWLVKMTAARYRIAFEIERSAQGFWGSVLCVSGPLGLYNMALINKIKDDWVRQEFMGQRCTFGDDRAMSNYILKEGYAIVMATGAVAFTEAPCDFTRFVSQQTRWCRSFWRELFLQLANNAVPNVWTWAELSYYGLFPVVLLSTVIADGFHRSGLSALTLVATCCVVPFIRIAVVNLLFGYQVHLPSA